MRRDIEREKTTCSLSAEKSQRVVVRSLQKCNTGCAQSKGATQAAHKARAQHRLRIKQGRENRRCGYAARSRVGVGLSFFNAQPRLFNARFFNARSANLSHDFLMPVRRISAAPRSHADGSHADPSELAVPFEAWLRRVFVAKKKEKGVLRSAGDRAARLERRGAYSGHMVDSAERRFFFRYLGADGERRGAAPI